MIIIIIKGLLLITLLICNYIYIHIYIYTYIYIYNELFDLDVIFIIFYVMPVTACFLLQFPL